MRILHGFYSLIGKFGAPWKRFCFGEQPHPTHSKPLTMRREPLWAYQNSSKVSTQSNQCSKMAFFFLLIHFNKSDFFEHILKKHTHCVSATMQQLGPSCLTTTLLWVLPSSQLLADGRLTSVFVGGKLQDRFLTISCIHIDMLAWWNRALS